KLKETTKIFTSIFPVWSLWYIGVLLIIYIISHIFSSEGMSAFFGFGMTANRTYLFVLAIISVLMFMEWAVNMGISRKTFYKSMMITGLVTAVFITAVVGIVSFGLLFSTLPGYYLFAENHENLTAVKHVLLHLLSG